MLLKKQKDELKERKKREKKHKKLNRMNNNRQRNYKVIPNATFWRLLLK